MRVATPTSVPLYSATYTWYETFSGVQIHIFKQGQTNMITKAIQKYGNILKLAEGTTFANM